MTVIARLLLAAILASSAVSSYAGGIATCTGQFPNPITDICWSCILPISIGNARIGNLGGQEDIDNRQARFATAA